MLSYPELLAWENLWHDSLRLFPRDRVKQSLQKYEIAFSDDETTDQLRHKLAGFYAQRTLTRRPIMPEDCARAIAWLCSDESAKTNRSRDSC
jgi:NAD(P)-dependent dehydrogenase (short-subunit alcohol dehydrogenase family)